MKHTTILSREQRLARAQINNGVRLAATVPLLVMAAYFYGPRPLLLCAAALATALLCDVLCALLRRRPYNPADVSSLLFGVLLVCLMPATVSYTTVVIATACAILVGKHLFGGMGSYPFHPTALGYALAVVGWPAEMLTFPAAGTQLPLGNTFAFAASETPAYTLKLNGLPNLGSINVLLGNFAGPMGASAALVVLACGLILLAVRRFDLASPLTFFTACVLMVRLFPRVPGVEFSSLLFYEVMASGMTFAAVFLLQDEVTAPRSLVGRLLYGLIIGLVTMIFAYYGSYPYGICFGILSGNALSGYCERLGVLCGRTGAHREKERRKSLEGGKQTV